MSNVNTICNVYSVLYHIRQYWCRCILAKSLQLCLTLCNSRDYSPPGSSVHELLQARILEWVAMLSSRDLDQHLLWLLHWQTSSLPLVQPYVTETLENIVIFQNSWSLYLKYCLQLKRKEDVVSNTLELQRGVRLLTWRWKSKCLINKCLMGPAETQWDTDRTLGSKAFCVSTPHIAHILYRYLCW